MLVIFGLVFHSWSEHCTKNVWKPDLGLKTTNFHSVWIFPLLNYEIFRLKFMLKKFICYQSYHSCFQTERKNSAARKFRLNHKSYQHCFFSLNQFFSLKTKFILEFFNRFLLFCREKCKQIYDENECKQIDKITKS